MRFMFQKWPRLVAEYKPAFGAIFSQYLINYTHWGYSDLDVILGDVAAFISRSELTDYHIVTYSFGDSDALYLRGQWTVHQNLPNINSIWMGCEHLSSGLEKEILQKVAWVRRNEAAGRITYHKRFLSAEGCYSSRAMQTSGIKVKISQKQFAGLERDQQASAVAYVIRGALWLCEAASGEQPDVAALAAASELQCDESLPELQPPANQSGEPQSVEVGMAGCGAWVPPEYRLCAESLKGKVRQTVVRRDGQFFAQTFEHAPRIVGAGGQCHQGAFFHMQEWKKRWEDGLSHIDPRAQFDTFRLDQSGIHRLVPP